MPEHNQDQKCRANRNESANRRRQVVNLNERFATSSSARPSGRKLSCNHHCAAQRQAQIAAQLESPAGRSRLLRSIYRAAPMLPSMARPSAPPSSAPVSEIPGRPGFLRRGAPDDQLSRQGEHRR